MKKNVKDILFYVVLIACAIGVAAFLSSKPTKDEMVYSDVINLFREEQVESFKVDTKNTIEITLKDESKVTYRFRDVGLFLEDANDMIREQHEQGIISTYDYPPPKEYAAWLSYLPYILIIGFLIVMYFVAMNQAMGGGGHGKINSFGRSRAHLINDSKNKVHFEDVAGADEEKEELSEVVEFLKNPKRYTDLGARIPRGVLLIGPPGTGKTLLAKAVAGEAGVPFYSISGSDFVEMYVGVGASRVRDLFENAKKNAPSIVFIDEIDAVGRHRGAGLGGGHDEREQTLNQLLVEMDGFGSNEGVIVIAATNRPDILDPALLRPGRFDRHVTVNYPDLKGRIDILKVHAKGKPFEDTVDLEKIAQLTVGFTGADLANLLNEAALLAARKHKRLIGMPDIEESAMKIMVGVKKKNRNTDPEERKHTAYHEAGHAVVAHLLPSCNPVREITIVPCGQALGYTLNPPTEDKYSVYKKELFEKIAELLGGRVAEKVFFDDISGGASNDIQRATDTARNMVTRYGMSEALGPVAYANERSDDEIFLGRDFNNSRNYSEETAFKIDNEIRRIVEDAYTLAEQIIRTHEDKMHLIADYLVQYETMDADQFKFVMDTDPTPTIDDVVAIADEKKKKSEEENAAKRAEKAAQNAEPASGSDESEDR